MVYVINFIVKDKVDYGKLYCKFFDNRFDNIFVCYCIYIVFEFFEKKLGINV